MWVRVVVWFLLFVIHSHFASSLGIARLGKKKLVLSSSFIAKDSYRANQFKLFSSNVVTSPMAGHHVAVKTRNIEMAISFYSLLGFQVETKFRAGPAKAAWLQLNNNNARLELIEVPSYMLPNEGIPRAIDFTKHESLLGFNHLALNVTQCIHNMKLERKESLIDESCGCTYGLNEYMNALNEKSIEMFNKTLRVAVEPRQQIIGGHVYELSFIYDADGSLLELIHWTNELENKNIASGWEPWDGKGFNGPKTKV